MRKDCNSSDLQGSLSNGKWKHSDKKKNLPIFGGETSILTYFSQSSNPVHFDYHIQQPEHRGQAVWNYN